VDQEEEPGKKKGGKKGRKKQSAEREGKKKSNSSLTNISMASMCAVKRGTKKGAEIARKRARPCSKKAVEKRRGSSEKALFPFFECTS